MLSYLLRRLLLFVPTLIGATAVIFLLMAMAPISIVDALLPPGGELQPGQRATREAYIKERYGLGAPPSVQYLRWLNNVSPLGFKVWRRSDPAVLEATNRELDLRTARQKEMAAAGAPKREIDEAVKTIDLSPSPGDFRFNKFGFKVPDLGESYIRSRPVWPIIAEALPVTLILQAVSMPISIAIALLTGIWAASHRGKIQDAASSFVLLAAYSIPVIWVGVMLIGFLANVEFVRAFPAGGLHHLEAEAMSFFPRWSAGDGFERGYLLDSTWHLVLPVICISYYSVAFYSKLTRTALLETLGSDFVRTARAKGLSEGAVLYRHAFRNSLIPLITVAASFLPLLVTGSIVVETIFNINGMGKLTIDALFANDRELFLSLSLLILLLQLGGYLIADIMYVIADPRVSYGK
jgi:ABC-type dipeptide/oligopeptide/nickel transport system permease component